MQTSKKQKFIGTEEFINAETGEIVPMQVVSVEDRDFNFHKVWLQHLVDSLDGISNQKLRLAFWIIDNLDKENKLVMTQRTIAKKSGMSLYTVIQTMKALQEGEPAFLVKINSGAYMVNPNVIWKGSYKSRMGVIYDYSKSQAEQNASNKEDDERTKKQELQELDKRTEDAIQASEARINANMNQSENITQNIKQQANDAIEAPNDHINNKTETSKNILGKCPNCGNNILWGQHGAYCSNKCGINVSKIYGIKLSKEQVQTLLNGKSISYTANGWKNTVFPEIENHEYNGKTTPEWKRKGEKI